MWKKLHKLFLIVEIEKSKSNENDFIVLICHGNGLVAAALLDLSTKCSGEELMNRLTPNMNPAII